LLAYQDGTMHTLICASVNLLNGRAFTIHMVVAEDRVANKFTDAEDVTCALAA
jgi:hypothetical protein